MRRQLWIAATLIVTLSSCNLSASQTTEMPASTLTPLLDAPTSSSPTATLVPIETLVSLELPTITSTSTPSTILASPKDQPVNCRFGPATSYAIIGALILGRQAEVIGRNTDSTWWYVRNPSDPSTSCWLSAEFVQITGDVQSLPVVGSPEIMVTGISVSIEPSVIHVACDALPQTAIITARITASGPATVTWHWASSSGVVSPDKQILFEVGDTKTVQDYYQVNRVSDYIVQVQTTLPNIVTGQASLKVVCTP
jgi:uncharacterized protein YraI